MSEEKKEVFNDSQMQMQALNLGQNIKNEFSVLSDIVDLPSKGIFYSKYNNISQLDVTYMVHKDEAILQTPGKVRSGVAFDELLERKIKTKNINVKEFLEDMLPGDRFAILMFLRITAYGNEYNVEVTSPFTGNRQKHVVLLNKLKTKELQKTPNANLEYETVVDFRGKQHQITFKILSQKEEKLISDKVTKLMSVTNIDNTNIERMKQQITTLDGDNSKVRIGSFVENMSLNAAKKLKNEIEEVEPGIDMEYEFTCQDTGNTFQAYVPITPSFFY